MEGVLKKHPARSTFNFEELAQLFFFFFFNAQLNWTRALGFGCALISEG